MKTDRDLKMGRALARIPVPELSEGYYTRLVAMLEQERTTAAPRPRRRVLRVGLVAAAVAAIVTVAVVLFGLPGVHDSGPQASLAAQVLAKMTSSFGSVRTLAADEVGVDYQNGNSPVRTSSRVFLAANGDGRVEDERGRWAMIHNAELGTLWSLELTDGRLVASQVSTRLPTGSVFSNPGDSARFFMGAGYGTALRALLAAHQRGMDVRTSTLDGRPTWTVTFADHSAKHEEIRLIVDQQTGLVFGSSWRENGHPMWEHHVENVRINEPLDPALFRPPAASRPPQSGANPSPNDSGFRRVSLGDVKGLVGYAPLVPAKVPDGFTLADVTASVRSAASQNQPGHNPLVSMVYRRGLGSFTVALMPGGEVSGLNDFAGGAFTAGDLSQSLTLKGGAMSGSRADVFIGLWAAVAQVYVHSGHVPLDVVIRGDLTRDELVAVAESLQTYSGGN